MAVAVSGIGIGTRCFRTRIRDRDGTRCASVIVLKLIKNSIKGKKKKFIENLFFLWKACLRYYRYIVAFYIMSVSIQWGCPMWWGILFSLTVGFPDAYHWDVVKLDSCWKNKMATCFKNISHSHIKISSSTGPPQCDQQEKSSTFAPSSSSCQCCATEWHVQSKPTPSTACTSTTNDQPHTFYP